MGIEEKKNKSIFNSITKFYEKLGPQLTEEEMEERERKELHKAKIKALRKGDVLFVDKTLRKK